MSLPQRAIRSIWHLPNERPTLSSLLTIAIGVAAALIGLLMVVLALDADGSAIAGLLLGAVAMALLGLAAHAGLQTDWFRFWRRDVVEGRYVVRGHELVRWIGPAGLLCSLPCLVLWMGALA